MIVVKICMWPLGFKEKEFEIARAFITNDTVTTYETNGEKGSYKAKFMQSKDFNPEKVWKYGHAENVDRQKRGVWDILYLCLKSIGMEKRNPKKG